MIIALKMTSVVRPLGSELARHHRLGTVSDPFNRDAFLYVYDMTASIELIGKGDKTIVRITENGKPSDKAFNSLTFAHAYAASQAIRLGLPIPDDARKTAWD